MAPSRKKSLCGRKISSHEKSPLNRIKLLHLGVCHFSTIGSLLVQMSTTSHQKFLHLEYLQSLWNYRRLSSRGCWPRSSSKAPLLVASGLVSNQRFCSRSLWCMPFWQPYRSARSHFICSLTYRSNHLTFQLLLLFSLSILLYYIRISQQYPPFVPLTY